MAAVHASITLPAASSQPVQANEVSESLQTLEPDTSPLLPRIIAVLRRTWDLGFTAFGGPPVHFAILHRRFVQNTSATGPVTKEPWLDEQTFQELFAVCQSLPGPGSTKMLFCIALIHAGVVAAFVAFLFWSLPAALVMYGLALGVGKIGDTLPAPVYALLSGLNASTVGVVALAAVQLADKSIKDRMTRILVIWGGCAGLCYNALWYFPVLIVAGGTVCGVWDVWAARAVERAKLRWKTRRERRLANLTSNTTEPESVEMTRVENLPQDVQRRRRGNEGSAEDHTKTTAESSSAIETTDRPERSAQSAVSSASTQQYYGVPIATGIGLIALTVAILVALILPKSLLAMPPRPLALLARMYQAGILIFGGGPVVIPLLRDYVVDPGWVSSRDFLIGLAIIQAMPGPNFNFSVYLGALAVARTGFHSALGALLGFVGIFTPGLLLTLGVQGLWSYLRTKPVVVAVLRGINATAVGLVFTAVYRLWEIGYLTPEDRGKSLAEEPWWVVVAALTYCEVAYFSVPPFVAIIAGAVLGLCWYGAVGQS